MPLTLRPTKGFGPDHFSAFEGQRKIGRIYTTRENGWFWGVDWFEAGFMPVADYAATPEQALADLQKACRRQEHNPRGGCSRVFDPARS